MAREFEERDRFVDVVFREELRRLNSHLPKNRRTLEDLLADSSPTVTSVSGHLIRLKKEELDDLSKSLPAEAPKRIRLPIVLLRRRDLGIGAFTILGDPYEEFAILLVAGGYNGPFDEFRRQHRDTVTLYKPQVSQLVRRFHSLIIIGFGTGGFGEQL